MERPISLLGLAVFVAIAFLMSDGRKRINWRLVAWGYHAIAPLKLPQHRLRLFQRLMV
ncbi:MAG: Na+ dependent nucleoside transporter N-terminal domain-containing protein [Deltaproteobacteria bacterium]